MKWIKRISLFLFVGIVGLLIGGLVYLNYLTPDYQGETVLAGLHEEVEILFDEYGIPHIYASDEEDLYYALGYIHATERLFQMEMIRRAVEGRLSEVLGPDLIETDQFFRTLSITESARTSASDWPANPAEMQPYQKAAMAYLKGVNTYLETGKTPVEFSLIGIPKEPFTVQNLYEVTGYMAFGFAEGLKLDPLIEKMRMELGPDYLKDLVVHHQEGDQVIPVHPSIRKTQANQPSLSAHIHKIVESLPVSPFIGSNSWVLGPSRSASGQVIHANDPHIGYGQPSVWYEAHLEAPGVSIYGYFLAGFPFAVLGHNRHAAIGMTMFENDDVNFYRETLHPTDSMRVRFGDAWEPLARREETISVKGGEDVIFPIYTSRHGPLISEVLSKVRVSRAGFIPREAGDSLNIWSPAPVALSWGYLQHPSRSLESSYLLGNASNMDEARYATSLIAAPGLNIMYGDKEGNIAWWTTGKLMRFGDHVNTKFFLDGASGKDEVIRWLDFEENPHSENPPSGFVYSANNQPAADTTGFYYPGYYFPESRAKRIVDLLESRESWSAEQVREMILDDVNISHYAVAQAFVQILETGPRATETDQQVLALLKNWQGEHSIQSQGPVVFYKLLYHVLEMTFADELGPDDFEVFVTSPLRKRSLPHFVDNDSSLWWDNQGTADQVENRADIVKKAFSLAVQELTAQLGTNLAQWQWGQVHTLEHIHLLGRQAPMNHGFNVGPFPAPGGEEVINNIGFRLNGDGLYPATHGPSRRSVIDFAEVENSMSILPSGQSGSMMSPHYDDQAEMYINGQFRKQLMNREEIEETHTQKRLLLPE